MLSVHCSSRIKSWRNMKKFAKNIKSKPSINKHITHQENITRKSSRNINALNVFVKKWICCLHFKIWKPNHENQIILLIIPNGKGWHYLAVKKLSAWFRGIISKRDGHFYCLNCLHWFSTKNLNSIKKYLEEKISAVL